MRIGTNVLSMNARQSLYENEKRMYVAMEHLATGKKLNHAYDNPANVGIVTRMHARASGMHVAIRNNEDAISMLRTAEAALQTVMNILQRMRDLAVQSANSINSNKNRDALNKEFQSLTEQIGYIGELSVFDDKNRPVTLDNISHTVNITNHISLPLHNLTSRFQQNKKQERQFLKWKRLYKMYHFIVLILGL